MEEFDAILECLGRHPSGMGLDDLQQSLSLVIPRRTLQRRLSLLVAQGRVQCVGAGRGVRYRPLRAQPELAVPGGVMDGGQPLDEVALPLSAESEAIRAYIRQPIQQRQPVSYQRRLLENYRPNETPYLSQEICQHLLAIGRPQIATRPAGTHARGMFERLLIDLSWASSRLEGNTYSRLDTQNLIQLGEEAEGKDRREAQMILNHKAAIELLVDQAEEIGFNPYTLLNLHALLSDNLLADPSESGRLRRRIVEVSGTVFYPLAIPQQIEGYFHLILEKAGAIQDPFEQAFFAMCHIPYLQPFVDVNKRVSRLAANIPLIKHNLCPLSFVDVPEGAYVDAILGFYELQRTELLRDLFIWAYERSCQRYMAIRETLAEPDPLRLRYREELNALVRETVQALRHPEPIDLNKQASELLPKDVVGPMVEMVLNDLDNLHEGNISRYHLRLSEYRAWRSALDASGGCKDRDKPS
jgi:Fic family protein